MVTKIPELAKFGLSKSLGFLSDEPPLQRFSNLYFDPWDKITATLPDDVKSHEIADKIRRLPILRSSELVTELEYRRAYVVLAFMIHGYTWGGSSDGKPLDKTPPQLAEPFLAVCHHLGLQPVLSYAGLCLWNWAATGDGDSAPDPFPHLAQMKSMASFTGTRGEDAFYHVPVLVEAEGGPLLSLLLKAVAAAEDANALFVIKTLCDAADTFVRMGAHLPKLYPVLDADLFYRRLRPFFGAGSGNEDKGLPRGVVFQKSDGSELQVKCIAGTAGQSALFQFLDLVLGVEHKKPQGAFFQEMRTYMPRRHREFLDLVSKLTPLRVFVHNNQQNVELVDAYDNCMKQLRLWRGRHIAVVSKYIVRPARQAAGQAVNGQNGYENIDGGLGNNNGEELRGTGGSALIPFLRQTRDETLGSNESAQGARMLSMRSGIGNRCRMWYHGVEIT